MILGVWAIVKLFKEKKIGWRVILFSSSGLILGWLARPNPFGAAKLAYIQIVELMLVKSKGIPLNFGLELYPLGWQALYLFLPFALLWLLAIYIFLKQPQKGLILWSSFSISAIFLLMAVFTAQRSSDFWAAFGIIFIAFVYPRAERFGARVLAAVVMAALFMAGQSLYQNSKFLKAADWTPSRFQGAGEWLKNNSEPGDIVFNASWDYFPELFFWNRKNYYIGGMDPVFQYAYDPKLYWEAYYLETGKTAEFTCPAVSCDEKTIEDTYAVLKNNFRARYVVLSKSETPAFYNYLSTSKNYSLKNEGQNTAVFELR